MENLDFDKLSWQITDWWSCASDKARNELIKLLNDRCRHKPIISRCWSDDPPADMRFCIDYSDDMYRVGDRCVYMWVTDDCVPFYVGYGYGNRAIEVHSRSKGFEKVFSKSEFCKVFIIANFVRPEIAQEIETLCIWRMVERGWDLKNDQKTMVDEDKYNDLKENYSNVFTKINELVSFLIKNMLGDGLPRDYKVISSDRRDKRYTSKNFWEIDGVVKSAKEWCKLYGQDAPFVVSRIAKYGMTPKEALTFPKFISNRTRYDNDIVRFWEENGCYIGRDNTSRVISLYYLGKYRS